MEEDAQEYGSAQGWTMGKEALPRLGGRKGTQLSRLVWAQDRTEI